jgi:hypothetical protein
MAHTIEPATSGRAKCRGCGRSIAAGELRFGERLPNPFAEGDMTVWFHLDCAACRRGEALTATLPDHADLPGRDRLQAVAEASMAHPRLERLAGIERATSARSRCRHCRKTIERDGWRVRISHYEEGMFAPGGFIHLGCAKEYFGTGAIVERLIQFGLDAADVGEVEACLDAR